MKINGEQARELARQFRGMSVGLGDYRFAKWATLTPAQRQQLEDTEWTLLNASSDLITQAVGLDLDEAVVALSKVTSATKRANAAIAKIKNVKKAISIAAGAVTLAAAIATGDVGAIAGSAKELLDELE